MCVIYTCSMISSSLERRIASISSDGSLVILRTRLKTIIWDERGGAGSIGKATRVGNVKSKPPLSVTLPGNSEIRYCKNQHQRLLLTERYVTTRCRKHRVEISSKRANSFDYTRKRELSSHRVHGKQNASQNQSNAPVQFFFFQPINF